MTIMIICIMHFDMKIMKMMSYAKLSERKGVNIKMIVCQVMFRGKKKMS